MKKKLNRFPVTNTIKVVRNKDHVGLWDFDLYHIPKMKRFSEVEFSAMIYPYSRHINARHIVFTPFEEYVKDITADQPSAYNRITDGCANVFGLLLGGSIFLLFYLFKFSDLLSVESIVSIFGAYLIGKEMWDDIENILIRLTRGKRFRYERSEFAFQKDRHTVLALYQGAARKRRYGASTLTPERINFVQQSNSQMLRLLFRRKDLRQAGCESAHLFSMRIPAKQLHAFEEKGSMLTIRLGFVRKFLWWDRSYEFFQSLDAGSFGALDADGSWHDEVVLTRRIKRSGRIRRYGKFTSAGSFRMMSVE